MTPRARTTTIAALLASVVVVSCGGGPSDGTARIVRVSDGDTIVVDVAGREEKVRLIGVDTPETKHPTKPVGCWGPEASAHTTSLLPPGTEVELRREEEARDRYGRLLAHVVRVSDGLDVNLDLVEGGWAVPMSIEPNTRREAEFAAAANRAAAAGLGLWGACER